MPEQKRSISAWKDTSATQWLSALEIALGREKRTCMKANTGWRDHGNRTWISQVLLASKGHDHWNRTWISQVLLAPKGHDHCNLCHTFTHTHTHITLAHTQFPPPFTLKPPNTLSLMHARTHTHTHIHTLWHIHSTHTHVHNTSSPSVLCLVCQGLAWRLAASDRFPDVLIWPPLAVQNKQNACIKRDRKKIITSVPSTEHKTAWEGCTETTSMHRHHGIPASYNETTARSVNAQGFVWKFFYTLYI